MKECCLELLTKLDKCMEDPDFQLLIVMKFLRSFTPLLEGLKDERGKDSM